MTEEELYTVTTPITVNPVSEATLHKVIATGRAKGWTVTWERQYRGWWTRVYLVKAHHLSRAEVDRFEQMIRDAS